MNKKEVSRQINITELTCSQISFATSRILLKNITPHQYPLFPSVDYKFFLNYKNRHKY